MKFPLLGPPTQRVRQSLRHMSAAKEINITCMEHIHTSMPNFFANIRVQENGITQLPLIK